MTYVCTLSKELQEKAQKELNEDPEKRAEDIEHIRKWIQEQPHLINIRTDDFLILRFLRGCKFSLEKTKQRIDFFYTQRTSLPEWFTERDPQNPLIREILKQGVIVPLKDTDNNGTRVFIYRPTAYNTKDYDLKTVSKAVFLLMDVFFEIDEISQINGIGFIIDAKDLGFNHVMYYSPMVVKNALTIWQEGYPADNVYWNYINHGRIFQILFNILVIFVNEEIRKRIRMCDSIMDKMYEIIPKHILPEEYGGEGGCIDDIVDHWLDLIDSKRDWILEDEKCTVVESKRPKK